MQKLFLNCSLKLKKFQCLSSGRGFQGEGTASAEVAWQERDVECGSTLRLVWARSKCDGTGGQVVPGLQTRVEGTEVAMRTSERCSGSWVETGLEGEGWRIKAGR